jgi:hypothetical protein
MTIVQIAAASLLLFQTAAPAAKKPATAAPKAAASKAAPAAAAATEVGVTVNYKGKGPVDAGHKIVLFAFGDPNITSGSRPIGAAQFASKNGETLTFKNITSPIYVFAVYDEKGSYDGVSGPPPAGLPSTIYRKAPKGAPTAVAPGSPVVKFSFDDSERWSK